MSKRKLRNFDPLLFQGIAHRGLHDEEAPENSMAAFKKAVQANVAFELDVHLTLDGKLLVCHDSDMERVTGKNGIIENLTLRDIRTSYKLRDGSDLPTLEEVMAMCQERVPMVIELKPFKGKTWKVGSAVAKALKGVKDKKRYTIISFDPRSLLGFGRRRFTRGLLLGKEHFGLKKFAKCFDYLDVEDCLVNHSDTIRLAKSRYINTWTINTEEKLQNVLPFVDMITFERLPVSKIQEDIARK